MLARSTSSAGAAGGSRRAAAATWPIISRPPSRVAARKQSSLSVKWA